MSIHDDILQAARCGYTAKWLRADHPAELLELLSEKHAASYGCPADEVLSFAPDEVPYLDDDALLFVYDEFSVDIETFAKENP